MTQSNPFADFQSDPFFNFSDDFFSSPVPPIGDSQSPFTDILEEQPDLAFQGALQRANPTPNLLRQFQNQRATLFGQFEGLQEQLIRQDRLPDLRFADFIGNFDFAREAFRTPPSQRPGGGTSQFAPPTTFFR